MKRKKRKEIDVQIDNPFEKVRVEDLNDNYALIAYLFAKPKEAIYRKLIGRYDYKIIGGWGSGKTMLLKYISYETQVEVLKEKLRKAGVKEEEVLIKRLRDEFKKIDYLGIYIKTGQSGFKPFLKPGGEFKDGQRIRLVEFSDSFVEGEWCTKGHAGYVLEGRMSIDFNGDLWKLIFTTKATKFGKHEIVNILKIFFFVILSSLQSLYYASIL